MTTAEREELAYNILMEVSGNKINAAYTVKRYYANVMHLDEDDHFIARGMARLFLYPNVSAFALQTPGNALRSPIRANPERPRMTG